MYLRLSARPLVRSSVRHHVHLLLRLINPRRDLHRKGALGSVDDRRQMAKYADALAMNARGDSRALAANIKRTITAGDLDADAAALWFVGCALQLRSSRNPHDKCKTSKT